MKGGYTFMCLTPNYLWTCKKCGETTSDFFIESEVHLFAHPKCSKCGGEMEGKFIISGGPFPEHPFKKY